MKYYKKVISIVILLSFLIGMGAQAAFENTYHNTGNMPLDLLGVAQTQLGYKEGDDNYTKYGVWYPYNNGHGAWCAMFVSWCADQSDIPTSIIPKHCNCNIGMQWFQKNGQWQDKGRYIPKAGDIVYFGSSSSSNHVGIVESSDGKTVNTIEGNADNQCKRNTYSIGSGKIIGYGVPIYNGKVEEEGTNKTYPVPISAYTIKNERITTYAGPGGEITGYIDGEIDECLIAAIYEDEWTKVRYPTVSGTKTAYCKLDSFISKTADKKELKISKNIIVYRKPDMGEKFGTVYPTDQIQLVGAQEERFQIIYNLDSGGYKMGWIYKKDVEENEVHPPSGTKEPLILEMNALQLSPGEEGCITVSLNRNSGILGLGLTINYPDNLLSINRIEKGLLLAEGTFADSVTEETAGTVKVLWSHAEEVKKDGELLRLYVTAREGITEAMDLIQVSALREDTFNERYEELTCEPAQAKIDISSVVLGDVNLDGLLNNKDAAMLSRYLVYKEDFNRKQQKAADVNQDAVINNRDVAKLNRKLVGKE